MACKYVKDFTFDSKEGFTGSAGQTMVKGYARGGKCYSGGGQVTEREAALATARNGRGQITEREARKILGVEGAGLPITREMSDRARRAAENEGLTLVREEIIVPKPKPENKKQGGPVRKSRSKGERKIARVMSEYKEGTLRSGSKKGPRVTNPKQAKAIALNVGRKAGADIPAPKKAATGGLAQAAPTTVSGNPNMPVELPYAPPKVAPVMPQRPVMQQRPVIQRPVIQRPVMQQPVMPQRPVMQPRMGRFNARPMVRGTKG